ncbi:twin-arginine translocase TatA/TatE family subunit [Halobacteriales archaeon SW_6_65_15]|nr:MAG: twin-arginine translocase TatA/TatE family subunit [Halobacteriales archaeon SW_6_65_15]
MDPIPLFGPVPGGMEMMIILLIAVLLFGANKLPKLARSTGAAMGEFKKGREQAAEYETDSGVERDEGLDGNTEVGNTSTDEEPSKV